MKRISKRNLTRYLSFYASKRSDSVTSKFKPHTSCYTRHFECFALFHWFTSLILNWKLCGFYKQIETLKSKFLLEMDGGQAYKVHELYHEFARHEAQGWDLEDQKFFHFGGLCWTTILYDGTPAIQLLAITKTLCRKC